MALTDKLTAIADAIRGKTGKTEEMTLDQMVTEIAGIEAGGGGSTSNEEMENLIALIEDSKTDIEASSVTKISTQKLRYGTFETLSLPNVTEIAAYGIANCTSLKSLNLPSVTTLTTGALCNNTALAELTLPSMVSVATQTIQNNTALKKVDLPVVTKLATKVFTNDSSLDTLILRSPTVCTLDNVACFTGTPFATDGTSGICYVPSALIESYQTAANWSTLYEAGTCIFAPIEGSQYETSDDSGGEAEVTLSSISAVYSGGDVTAGTAVNDLTGIVVTAHYSDGTSEPVTGYTLSGTIAEGSNTITVNYEGMTTTFAVTGMAESESTYTVTSGLKNVESSNPSAIVTAGESYTATLTVADGYEMGNVIVTMGGVDITADVYVDGVINIAAVTGDVIITASAAAVPTDIMSKFKWLGPTLYSPATYTAWCPTGLIYDESRDVYAHFMHCQTTHYGPGGACEIWFNTINPDTLAHTEPVFIARTMDAGTGSKLSGAGMLGTCIKDGVYYIFGKTDRGYFKSEDGGKTWSKETYETGPTDNPWGCYILDNGRMIMGSDAGTHVVYYSDDNGKNWVEVQSEHFNEPTFIDFGGGVIMAICRENMDADKNIQRPWMHVSRDYGATWTESATMETVGYMGNNNCNAYVHDSYVELFVGCRIPTDSPQYTDTLYQINQYVMDINNGPIDGFEFVNTVYQYKNDDNHLGQTTTLTGADDFSTPCIAIKDKSHALLMFYAPGWQHVTHHFIAVGNIPVDDFEIPRIIPSTFNASQTFGNDSPEITVCNSYGVTYDLNNYLGYPNLTKAGQWLDVSDIADGGYLHIKTAYKPTAINGWQTPLLAYVKDMRLYSVHVFTNITKTPRSAEETGYPTLSGTSLARWYPDDGSVYDIYARFWNNAWWLYYGDVWIRQYYSDSGSVISEDITDTGRQHRVVEPYTIAGETSWNIVALSEQCLGLRMLEYDKIIDE